jgi:hypothetical protein
LDCLNIPAKVTTVDTLGAGGQEVLRWRIHLARLQPKRYAFVVAVILLVATSAYAWFHSPLASVIMVFVLTGALSDFLFPVTFILTSTQDSARTVFGRRVIEWKSVKKVYVDDRGVKLSPLGTRSRLEAYRGVYLYFGDNREAVLAAVSELRPKNV